MFTFIKKENLMVTVINFFADYNGEYCKHYDIKGYMDNGAEMELYHEFNRLSRSEAALEIEWLRNRTEYTEI